MDRRQRRTRHAIFQAFTALLEKKSYSAITVQEIIDRADVGRSTFYAHFETKDDLLNALCAEIFEHVFSEALSCEASHDFSAGDHDIDEHITHMLYHLRDNRTYIRSILSSESGEVFMRFFKDHLARVFEGEIPDIPRDIPRDYMLNHMVCDFAESVRWWMDHPTYTPEQISAFFRTTTPFRPRSHSHG